MTNKILNNDVAIENQVLVSVCVISYNHSQYIRECLESIVRQKTDFNFEVVVRDDLSSDDTADQIQLFVDQYPNIIRFIKANQNVGANRNLIQTFACARGTYIAICEGDDYWIDDLKLQKQVGEFERNPECTFISHTCRVHDKNGIGDIAFLKSAQLLKFDGQNVLDISGQFAPTASYMFRKDSIDHLPDWFVDAPVGDFFLEMYGLRTGHGIHLPDVMSVYRVFSYGSWSEHYNEKNFENLVLFSRKMLNCLNLMRVSQDFYHHDFSRKIASVLYNMAIGSLLSKNYKDFSQAISDCQATYPSLSKMQFVFYKLESTPRLAYGIYFFRKYLIKCLDWLNTKLAVFKSY